MSEVDGASLGDETASVVVVIVVAGRGVSTDNTEFIDAVTPIFGATTT